MKTILVPTDFSEASENAALYAIELAKSIKAKVKLCNAFKVPAEMPMAAQVSWPLEDYSDVRTDVEHELKTLAGKLTHKSGQKNGGFDPKIEYTCEAGSVTDLVRNIVDEEQISIVVIGMSTSGPLSHFFSGSISRTMIDKADCPVLLIPPGVKFKKIEKIAFATDLNNGDINVIHSLAGLAYYMNAELLIAHIANEKFNSEAHQHQIDAFLTEVSCKANYAKIYYRNIKSMDVEHGLDWLTEHGQIDMLVMVHRWHHFFNRIIAGSYTKKMVGHIHVPLLVYSGNDGPSTLPVF
jgi:nucleotide-binding universal stress UspA family protein